MCIVCRHDGHCDEATPDERAPFRVWSLLFSVTPPFKQKARDFSRAFAFRVERFG